MVYVSGYSADDRTQGQKSDKDIEIVILNLLSHEREYRHNVYWNIIYKSIFAITTLMSLPFFLYEKDVPNRIILSTIPFFAALICIVTAFLLKMESLRIDVVNQKRNDIIYRNSSNTREENEAYNSKMRDKTKTNFLTRFAWQRSIADTIWWFYIVLFIVCITEGVLILQGKIFL